METVTERELFCGILGCFLFPFLYIGNFVTNLLRGIFPMGRIKETYNLKWGCNIHMGITPRETGNSTLSGAISCTINSSKVTVHRYVNCNLRCSLSCCLLILPLSR